MMTFVQLLLNSTACNSNEEAKAEADEGPKVTIEARESEAKVEIEGDTPPAATVDIDTTPAATVEVLKLPSPSPSKKDSTDGKQKVKRWLGLSVANMTEPIAGVPEDARTQIQRAARGSPAHKAGLRRGDVITAASGQPVRRFQDYLKQARNVEMGEEFILQVARNGHSFPVRLKMRAKPGNLNLWKRQSFPGTEAFPFTLTSLRPEGAELGPAKDKPQLLYFWATWCGPCRQVAPAVEKLHKDAGLALDLIAVSSEEQAVIKRYLRASRTSYPVAHDAKGWLKQDYEVRKLPTAVLIGRDGKVIAWDYGLGGVRKVLNRARIELQL